MRMLFQATVEQVAEAQAPSLLGKLGSCEMGRPFWTRVVHKDRRIFFVKGIPLTIALMLKGWRRAGLGFDQGQKNETWENTFFERFWVDGCWFKDARKAHFLPKWTWICQPFFGHFPCGLFIDSAGTTCFFSRPVLYS